MARDAERGRLSSLFLDAAPDIAGWFAERGVERITFLRGGDDDAPELPGPEGGSEGGSEGEVVAEWRPRPQKIRSVTQVACRLHWCKSRPAGRLGDRGARARSAREWGDGRADRRRRERVTARGARADPARRHGHGRRVQPSPRRAPRRVIPSTIGRVAGVETHTTGLTAQSRDFNDSMKSHAPIVFAFVLGLAFVLLLVTFRSIVVPIKAIVLNLLSVGAAYGVLVLVFQDGRLESLLGFTVDRRRDVVAAAVPVRDPVRPVDGLPRAHRQPGARGARRGAVDRATPSRTASVPRRASSPARRS